MTAWLGLPSSNKGEVTPLQEAYFWGESDEADTVLIRM